MSKPKNLILFVEEIYNCNWFAVSFYPCHRNLVRLYMNRFVIEEEEQFDIIGIFDLTAFSFIRYSMLSPLSEGFDPTFFSIFAIINSWTFLIRETPSREAYLRWRYKRIFEEICAKVKTLEEHCKEIETHIIVGIDSDDEDLSDCLNLDNAMYLNKDYMNDSLERLISYFENWNTDNDINQNCNQLTLLCGLDCYYDDEYDITTTSMTSMTSKYIREFYERGGYPSSFPTKFSSFHMDHKLKFPTFCQVSVREEIFRSIIEKMSVNEKRLSVTEDLEKLFNQLVVGLPKYCEHVSTFLFALEQIYADHEHDGAYIEGYLEIYHQMGLEDITHQEDIYRRWDIERLTVTLRRK